MDQLRVWGVDAVQLLDLSQQLLVLQTNLCVGGWGGIYTLPSPTDQHDCSLTLMANLSACSASTGLCVCTCTYNMCHTMLHVPPHCHMHMHVHIHMHTYLEADHGEVSPHLWVEVVEDIGFCQCVFCLFQVS